MSETRRGMVYSALAHVTVISLMLFGLPQFPRHPLAQQHHNEPPPVYPVDYVKIGERTAAPDAPDQPSETPPFQPDLPATKAPAPKPRQIKKPSKHTPISANTATADLPSAIKAQVEPCWSVPAGARDVGPLKIQIHLELHADGTLAAPPEIIDDGRMADDFYRRVAESARAAVQRCTPLKLPPESYARWRSSVLTFDAQQAGSH